MVDFTGRLGGTNSSLGFVVLGYDALDEVVVTWIRNSHPDDNTSEMDFSSDESGNRVILLQNIPTVLTRAQAQQALNDGAILLILGKIS